MKKWKHTAAFVMAGVMLAVSAFPASASSPEFARTPEEWARLEDNVLEYEEIEDLIAEYNAAVQVNQLDLNEFKRKYGNIINISSIHGTMTMPGFGIYAGTKGALNATARAMALDYADAGIRVNNISPGLIMSDNMLDEINTYPEGKEREDFMEMLRHMQPLLPGKMEDIANAALFLASDMSSYITGQTIMVDGGASIKAH